MIQIVVNGEQKSIDKNTTMTGLLAILGFDPRTVAALLNDDIVARDRFDATALADGDQIELVRLVPGG